MNTQRLRTGPLSKWNFLLYETGNRSRASSPHLVVCKHLDNDEDADDGDEENDDSDCSGVGVPGPSPYRIFR